MELKKVLLGLEGLKGKGNLDIDVSGIENNSKNVKKGNMFVAIKGFETDGHNFIENAIENGATVIMVEEGCDLKSFKLPEDITLIMVPNTRKALAICAANFYNNPSKKFKLIGITGTKGKTTTTFMIKEILEKLGKKVGLIGTIATYINGKKIKDNSRTTPESLELQKIFSKMVEENVEYVVMEVSSQSLKLDRVEACEFDIVLFTNFSEDHISEREHPNMEDYFQSKLKLFKMCKTGIVNADDLHAAKIPKLFPESNITTYGIDNHADLIAKDITITNSYVDFKVKITDRNERIKVCIPGRFSVYNSLAAISVAKKLGLDMQKVKESLETVTVPGRCEMVPNKLDIPVMIDYAHSPESMEKILEAVRSYTKGRVICVFGCGGDRDRGKRPIMGEISAKYADYTILVGDNSRTENTEQIIGDIEEGVKRAKGDYEIVIDRTEGIKKAVKMATKRDLVLLAGKGHERYLEINGEKLPFDERIAVKEAVEEIENAKKRNK